MANLAVLLEIEPGEVLTQSDALKRTTDPNSPRWQARSTFLWRVCKSLDSIEKQQYLAQYKDSPIRPPAFKRPRGCHFKGQDILNAVDLSPHEKAALKILEHFRQTIYTYIDNAKPANFDFDPEDPENMHLWESHLDFFYHASTQDLRDGLDALVRQTSHPLADKLRNLPKEVLIGIRDNWLPNKGKDREKTPQKPAATKATTPRSQKIRQAIQRVAGVVMVMFRPLEKPIKARKRRMMWQQKMWPPPT